MSELKELKASIVDWNISILRRLKMSDKTIGYVIRSGHAMLPIYTTAVLFFGNQIYALMILMMLIMAFISFWIFNGCIITSIEYKLDNLDVTLMDPVVEILGMEVTPQSRMNVARYASLLYMIFYITIYFIRFGSLKLHNNIYDDLNMFKNFYQHGPTTTTSKPSKTGLSGLAELTGLSGLADLTGLNAYNSQ